mmetsp:Transcript_21715/g.60392  ORF Transcript_21715/g.60392 Transcript_21715/m.60392 type:complete len:214 (-) Transcript_21715:149-790(-)
MPRELRHTQVLRNALGDPRVRSLVDAVLPLLPPIPVHLPPFLTPDQVPDSVKFELVAGLFEVGMALQVLARRVIRDKVLVLHRQAHKAHPRVLLPILAWDLDVQLPPVPCLVLVLVPALAVYPALTDALQQLCDDQLCPCGASFRQPLEMEADCGRHLERSTVGLAPLDAARAVRDDRLVQLAALQIFQHSLVASWEIFGPGNPVFEQERAPG